MTFVTTKSQKLIYCLSLVSHSPYVISTKYFVSIESQHVRMYSVQCTQINNDHKTTNTFNGKVKILKHIHLAHPQGNRDNVQSIS